MTAAAPDVETARPIERAVLDYFEGWLAGAVARMRRALHPELAKRRAGETPGPTSAARMLELTALGGRKDAGPVEITIDDAYEDVAGVTVPGGPYHDYLHLVRTDAGWKIAKPLWRPR